MNQARICRRSTFLLCLTAAFSNAALADDAPAQGLRSSDVEARRAAAIALRNGDDASRKGSLPDMIELLKGEKDGQVRLAVLDAVASLGPEASPAVPCLIETLKAKRSGGGQEKTHQDYRTALALVAIGEPAVEGLRSLLSESRKNVRADALMAIGRIGPAASSAVPDLIALLGDADVRIRHESAVALGSIGEAAAEPLMESAKDKNPNVRESACEGMGLLPQHQRDQVEKSIFQSSRDEVPAVRAAALRSIALLNAPDSALTPILATSLRDVDEKVRLAAVRICDGRRELIRQLIPDLEALSSRDDPGVSRHAIFLLSKLGPEGAPLLLKASVEPTAGLERLAEGLTSIGKAILDLLVRSLKAPEPRTRSVAALAIGGIRPLPDGIDRSLAAGLTDDDPQARLAFLTALGKLGPKARASLPSIRLLLHDKSSEMKVRAIEVLAQASPRNDDLVTDFMTALDDTSPEVRERALERLRTLGPLSRRAIPKAVEALSGENPKVRIAAADLISGHGTMASEAVPALTLMLQDPSPETRILAATTLGKLGVASRPAFEPIAKLLEAEKAEVRAASVAALGSLELDAEKLRSPFSKALKDDVQEVRLAASAAIRKLGPGGSIFLPDLIPLVGGKNGVERLLKRFERKATDEASIPALIELLKSDSPMVRLNAAKFLGLAGNKAGTAVPALQRLNEDPSEDVRKQAADACRLIQEGPMPAKGADEIG